MLALLCSEAGMDDFAEFISVWSSLPSLFLSAALKLASQSAADFVVEPVVMPLDGAVAAGAGVVGGVVAED